MGTINKIYWTTLQLVTKIREDLDMQEETFISPSELLSYINEAIDKAESDVMGLYEDYFLTNAKLSITSGLEEYDLPVDIYAHKIRRIIFQVGSRVYRVSRIKDWHKFEEYSLDRSNSSSRLYKYFLINKIPGQPQILFSPIPYETITDAMVVWYTRQANRLEIDGDIMDIPEAYKYIISYAKQKCLFKEKNPAFAEQKVETADERKEMITTLATMVPDGDNYIEPDYSSYEEHS